MLINKWHGAVDGGRGKAKTGSKGVDVNHWILVNDETFARIEAVAVKRGKQVSDIVDEMINKILDVAAGK